MGTGSFSQQKQQSADKFDQGKQTASTTYNGKEIWECEGETEPVCVHPQNVQSRGENFIHSLCGVNKQVKPDVTD